MKVLVFGGRDFTDYEALCRALDVIHAERGFTQVIHGNAFGVDRLAGAWARERGIPVRKFPADWKRYGPSAGPIRNAEMLVEGQPDLGVAFPGGAGTRNMRRQAKKAGLEVIDVE